MGMICSVIANFLTWAYADPKKKVKKYEPDDFIPDYNEQVEQEKPKQTMEEMKAILQTLIK